MYRLIYLLICLPLLVKAQNISPRDLLSGEFTREKVARVLVPVDEWHHFPVATDREAWESLPAEVKKSIIEQGDEALDFSWPGLPASLYLEFSRIGNRSNYEAVYFERRRKLASLVLAEALTLVLLVVDFLFPARIFRTWRT